MAMPCLTRSGSIPTALERIAGRLFPCSVEQLCCLLSFVYCFSWGVLARRWFCLALACCAPLIKPHHVMSRHVTSRLLLSPHLTCRSVPLCHIPSVLSLPVPSRPFPSHHAASCRVASRRVASRRVASHRDLATWPTFQRPRFRAARNPYTRLGGLGRQMQRRLKKKPGNTTREARPQRSPHSAMFCFLFAGEPRQHR